MKEHSEEFKNQIKELGRQFRSQLSYGNNILEEELYAITPLFNGNLLKSTMKQLDVETTEDIPVGTEVNYKLGMLVEEEWEWLDYGNYYVYTSEKQEDKDIYKLVCYDKLLNAMKTYEGVEGSFPMTLRDYLQAVCDKLEIDFGSADETFANYDRELPSDRYLGLEDYTYRDVLDEIAQATASMICLNNDDKLVIKYINEGIDNYNTVQGTSFTLTDASSTKQASILELQGQTSQSGTPTPSNPIEVKTVSGDNNIVVSNKNLFDSNKAQIGKAWNNTSNTARAIVIIKVEPNTKYTISFQSITGLELWWFGRANENDSTRTDGNYQITTSPTTITTNATTNYLGLQFNKTSIAQSDIDNCNIQLEKGTTATSYIAHQCNSYRVDLGGKNLLNIKDNLRNSPSNGITTVYNNDNSITISGTTTSTWSNLMNNTYVVLGTGTYTLSINEAMPFNVYLNVLYNDGTSQNPSITRGNTSVTWTTDKVITRYRLDTSGMTNNTVYNKTFFVQLETGSQATPFSPYTANPIELCKIGNYVDKLKRAEGKNLFDKDNMNKLNAYFESNNVIIASNYNRIFYIECEPNTTYTIAQNPSTSPISNHLLQVATSSVLPEIGVECTSNHNIGGDTSYTMTTNADAKYLVFRIRSGDDIDSYLSTIMINYGSTALPYEPYGVGKWYIEKNIRHIRRAIADMNNNENYPRLERCNRIIARLSKRK